MAGPVLEAGWFPFLARKEYFCDSLREKEAYNLFKYVSFELAIRSLQINVHIVHFNCDDGVKISHRTL